MEKYQDSSHANGAIFQNKQRKPIVTLAALGLIVLNCVSLIFLTTCSSSSPPSEPTIHKVVYELTGSEAALVNITLNNAGGQTEQKDEAGLPWTIEFDAPTGQLAYVSGQLAKNGNQIKCMITIDGRKVKEKASTGENSIATCSARIQ